MSPCTDIVRYEPNVIEFHIAVRDLRKVLAGKCFRCGYWMEVDAIGIGAVLDAGSMINKGERFLVHKMPVESGSGYTRYWCRICKRFETYTHWRVG